MILISVQELQKSFGVHEVLHSVTFSLQKGEKMGLVGVNGCGKTTLMRIIAGEMQPDGGTIHRNKDLCVGYLAQLDDIPLTDTVWGALLKVFEPIRVMERRMAEIEKLLESADPETALRLSSEYQRLTESYNAQQGYAYEGEILRVPDIILMDEPTNHLDLEAIEWLQDYLTDYKGSLLLISHDRYFLDHVCTTMGELLGGKMIKFTGNYTEYMKKRTADFETRMKAYELQQKEIQREQAIIERYRSFNREKSIKAAESREKRLAKVERLEKPVEEQHVRFSFDARRRSGEEALEVRELSKSFEGQPVFQNLSFKLRTGDRVALIGPNGVGKSTLFRILTHQINPDHGSVRFGTNIDIGYYDQHQQNLNPQNTILDEVWNTFPKLEQTRIRSALGLFLFTGDEVFEKIEKLSGGERGRVALTKLMLKQDNLLLLDEPTNHLDMDSREVLEDALRDFPGTILAISHDRYFINRFAEKVMVMEKDGVTEYLGNFDDYIEKRDRPRPPVSSLEDEPTRTAQTREKKKTRQQNALLRELKAAVDKAEAAIEQNEREMARLEAELARPETYNDLEAMRRLTESYQAEQDKTESLYEALEAAETALSEASEN